MGLQLERGVELIFSKKLKQTITHLIHVFLASLYIYSSSFFHACFQMAFI
jgi:hypothetical protein